MLTPTQLREKFYALSNDEKQDYIFELYKPLLPYMEWSLDFGFLYYEALDGDETGETYNMAFEKYLQAVEKEEIQHKEVFETMKKSLEEIHNLEARDAKNTIIPSIS